MVHGFIQIDEAGRRIEDIELMKSMDEMAEAYTYQADEHTSLIEFFEQVFYHREKFMVERSIRDLSLKAVRIEVGITYLYGNTGGEFLFFPQFES